MKRGRESEASLAEPKRARNDDDLESNESVAENPVNGSVAKEALEGETGGETEATELVEESEESKEKPVKELADEAAKESAGSAEEPQKSEDLKEAEEPKEPKESEDPKESKDPKDPKEASKDTKDSVPEKTADEPAKPAAPEPAKPTGFSSFSKGGSFGGFGKFSSGASAFGAPKADGASNPWAEPASKSNPWAEKSQPQVETAKDTSSVAPISHSKSSEENDVYAQVTLEKQDVKTGEEDEETDYQCRIRLYAIDLTSSDKAWKERGVGLLKLNRSLKDQKSRLVLRTDGNLKVKLNLPLVPNMQVLKGFESSLHTEKFVRIAGLEDDRAHQFALRVGSETARDELFDALANALGQSAEA